MGLMLPNMTTIEVPKDSFLAALATFLQSSGDAFEPRRFVVDHVSFEQDKAVVTQDSLPALANLAAILKAYPGSAIRLETRRDNRDRASAVQSVLEREGVPASQITVENLGPAEPKALKDTKEGEDQKRIELVVTRYVQKAEQPGTTAPSGKKKLLRALSETADIVVSNTSITNGKGTKNKDKNPQGPAIPLPK
jgi:hypothetical protein